MTTLITAHLRLSSADLVDKIELVLRHAWLYVHCTYIFRDEVYPCCFSSFSLADASLSFDCHFFFTSTHLVLIIFPAQLRIWTLAAREISQIYWSINNIYGSKKTKDQNCRKLTCGMIDTVGDMHFRFSLKQKSKTLKATSHYNNTTGNADDNTKCWRVARAVPLHRRNWPTDSSRTTKVCRSLELSVGPSALHSHPMNVQDRPDS